MGKASLLISGAAVNKVFVTFIPRITVENK